MSEKIFDESGLEFDFTKAQKARRFDDKNHKLSHCMKAVDFVVETAKIIFFIEVKNPGNPKSDIIKQQEFFENFKGEKTDSYYYHKYRDSFLYEWASDNINAEKKLYYVILVNHPKLDDALLQGKNEQLKRKLPVNGPWKKQIINELLLLNIEKWNKYFSDFPVNFQPK